MNYTKLIQMSSLYSTSIIFSSFTDTGLFYKRTRVIFFDKLIKTATYLLLGWNATYVAAFPLLTEI